MSSPTNQPVVSLILLSYNYERYIGDSVRSVLAQTYPHWELIVIDDASTDRSLEVVSSFSDPRIRVLRSAANSGPSRSYNLAYAGCRGQFIGSLDADDFLDPGKLALQVAAFEAEPDLDILGTFVTEVDDSGAAAAGGEVAAWFNQHRDLGAVENWLMRNHLCHSSVLVRRAAHQRFGLLNPQLRGVADYELWLRALAHGARFRVLAQPLIFSRQHERNAWHGIGRLSQFLELGYLYSSQLAPHLVAQSRLDLIAPCLAFFIRHFLEAASFPERRTAVRELGRFLDHPRDVAGFARAFQSGCGEAWPAIVDAVESVPAGAA